MRMGLESRFAEKDIILVVVPNKTYTKGVLDVTKQVSTIGPLIYVTLNQMADVLLKYYKKSEINVDNVLFIDVITKTIESKINELPNVVYVENLSSLTKLSLAICNSMKTKKFDFLVFDSVSTLMLQKDRINVNKMIRHVISFAKSNNVKVLFIALEKDEEVGNLKDLSMCVDETINVLSND
jgi:KaiC/GvpD/RAD55 family RecA-like ATPase